MSIVLPLSVFLEEEAAKVVALGAYGWFCLKPRHVDMATALVPGILSWWGGDGRERFVAVNGGLLVKDGDTVRVATRHAVSGELGHLREAVDAMTADLDDAERAARTAMARLEARFVRGVLDFGAR
nr:F0F1 ATP synthase subunit epsilon [Desulfobaculum xiamenense]